MTKTTPQHVLPWNETTLAFLLAGKCWVSLEHVLTGARYTYLVEQRVDYGTVTETDKDGKQVQRETIVKRHPFWIVSLQKGAIDEASPHYLGVIDSTAFRTSKGTAKAANATADNINTFGDVLRDLRAGQNNGHKVKIWHCGKCGHCARALSVPSSIKTGFGPDCAQKLGIEMADTSPTLIEKVAALDDGDQ